jgi:hypothetical protein
MLAVAVATVKIGVLGLFHPVELEVKPASSQVLVAESGGELHILDRNRSLRIRSAAKVRGRGGAMARFRLSVPGRFSREYTGRLTVIARDGELIPIVEMDVETAVASVVQGEMNNVSMEAMKAQAIVARSYLVSAKNRHELFDFCDTTHCQHLRELPRAASAVAKSVEATNGVTITYQGQTIPALYSGNCGGHTRTLVEAGWNVDDYPYYGVSCPVRGTISGHQLGLCQSGSAEMARRGSTYRQIIAHFFPATTLANFSNEAALKGEARPKLFDLLVALHFSVPDVDHAMGVHRDIVFMGH